MCGIAGAIARSPNRVIPIAVQRLTDSLKHRGPDGEGYWADVSPLRGRLSQAGLPESAGLVLGHRRLSIVDLTTGDQPMSNEDGSVWVTFNGEIYNHRELRGTLERSGHRFATTADTEVLVHGWEEWGEGLLPRLNGIFAFALADTRRHVTLLARDPAGVKPLYLGIDGDSTWWASELGAARQAGLASSEISRDALKLFLLLRYVPAPAAMLERAWKVPPGHFVVLDPASAGQTPQFRSYQTTIRSSADPRAEDEWRTALIGTLEAAVTRQLMSDVPVGSLLSGGVDSSLVTLLMDRHLPYHPQAFGIGFRSHGARSEAIAGARAAQSLCVPYTITEVDDAEYLAAWPTAFASTSEPIGNSGGLLVHLLCRAVGRTHKVVLSGQGADEPLGGYPRHMAERLHRLGRRAPGVSAWVAERLLGSGAGERLGRVLKASNRIDRYLEILTLANPELADRWVPGGTPARELGRAAIAQWVPQEETGDPLNDLLRVDARLSLADDLLNVADHHSMRASVELRVPFLDLEFLDLAERMPSRYKVSAIGERKWLYRQAATRTLPPTITKAWGGLQARLGRKLGFTTPMEHWFGGDRAALGSMRGWMEPLVHRGLFSQSAVSEFVDEAERQPRKRQRELLALYALSRWVEASE